MEHTLFASLLDDGVHDGNTLLRLLQIILNTPQGDREPLVNSLRRKLQNNAHGRLIEPILASINAEAGDAARRHLWWCACQQDQSWGWLDGDRFYLLHPSSKHPGWLQMSVFVKEVGIVGDSQHETLEDAICGASSTLPATAIMVAGVETERVAGKFAVGHLRHSE